MQREYVASSNIESVGYDEPSQTLEVGFIGGAVYQYYNITLNLYEEMIKSPSKGRFLSYNIKNVYPYSRVG